MTVAIADLAVEVLQRLGDASSGIWTGAEIEDYIKEGYDDLCIRTGCLWEVDCLPDYALAFNFTQEFERGYAEAVSGWYADGPVQFTSEFERDFIQNAIGPGNHTEHWEYTSGYQSITECGATVELFSDCYQVERATWNTIVTVALHSRDLEPQDSRYELNKGNVEGFIQDKDGLSRLRKWRIPSTAYTPYEFDSDSDDGYGIIRFAGDIAEDLVVVSGEYGDLVQVDSINVFEDFGIIGPVYKEANSLRVEYRRRGAALSASQPFEIQDRYTVYVRHYAMAAALGREGDGFEPELSAHYTERYLAGVERMAARREGLRYAKKNVVGGSGRVLGEKPPRVRMPWAYGQVVR